MTCRTPKGGPVPGEVKDGPAGGEHLAAHQVPLAEVRTKPRAPGPLEEWLRVTGRGACSGRRGAASHLLGLVPDGAAARRIPARERRRVLRDLVVPDFRDYTVAVPRPARHL